MIISLCLLTLPVSLVFRLGKNLLVREKLKEDGKKIVKSKRRPILKIYSYIKEYGYLILPGYNLYKTLYKNRGNEFYSNYVSFLDSNKMIETENESSNNIESNNESSSNRRELPQPNVPSRNVQTQNINSNVEDNRNRNGNSRELPQPVLSYNNRRELPQPVIHNRNVQSQDTYNVSNAQFTESCITSKSNFDSLMSYISSCNDYNELHKMYKIILNRYNQLRRLSNNEQQNTNSYNEINSMMRNCKSILTALGYKFASCRPNQEEIMFHNKRI